jgi:hypothetical protein
MASPTSPQDLTMTRTASLIATVGILTADLPAAGGGTASQRERQFELAMVGTERVGR